MWHVDRHAGAGRRTHAPFGPEIPSHSGREAGGRGLKESQIIAQHTLSPISRHSDVCYRDGILWAQRSITFEILARIEG